jgi:putative transposase
MPRANRYLLPGRVCHLTHRCHNRSPLFRFACDRTEYRKRLRLACKEFKVCLLTYCITWNHTHMLVTARDPENISAMMQKLEGEFAEYYNIRKRRSGAFWSGRYWSTMIDSDRYLWDCMKYVDLNMVRAGVVPHPDQWQWCGYAELMGHRQRYTMLTVDEILSRTWNDSLEDFRKNYSQTVAEAIAHKDLCREPHWTESIAVGSPSFIGCIEEETTGRLELNIEKSDSSRWIIRETGSSYM